MDGCDYTPVVAAIGGVFRLFDAPRMVVRVRQSLSNGSPVAIRRQANRNAGGTAGGTTERTARLALLGFRSSGCWVLGAGFRVVVEGGRSIGADVAVEDEKANARVHDSVPGAVRRLGATGPKMTPS
jgi:hypothetical protein